MLYYLESFEIYLDLVFFGKLILSIILGKNVKSVDIIGGKDEINKELKFEIWWDLLLFDWFFGAIIVL